MDHEAIIAENAVLRLQVAMMGKSLEALEKVQEDLIWTQRELYQAKHSLAIRQAECCSGRTALRLEQKAHGKTREKLHETEYRLRLGRPVRRCEEWRARENK